MTSSARSRRVAAVVAVAIASLLVAASAALAADVSLGSGGFEPETVSVDPGEEILWVNDSTTEQTIVGEDGSWDSGPLAPGETFSVALREPGSVAYGTEDGENLGQIEVRAPTPTAGDPPAQADSPPSMPRTGGPVGPAALLATVLLSAGCACLLAAPRRRGQ